MPQIDPVLAFDMAQDLLDTLHDIEIARITINAVMGLIGVLMMVVFYISVSSTTD